MTFDTVSLVPYDRKLIDTSLLSSVQVRNITNIQSSNYLYCPLRGNWFAAKIYKNTQIIQKHIKYQNTDGQQQTTGHSGQSDLKEFIQHQDQSAEVT